MDETACASALPVERVVKHISPYSRLILEQVDFGEYEPEPLRAAFRFDIGAQGELARVRPQKGRLQGEATVTETPFAYLIASVRLPGFGDYPLAISNPIYFH